MDAYLVGRGQGQQHDQWHYDEGPHVVLDCNEFYKNVRCSQSCMGHQMRASLLTSRAGTRGDAGGTVAEVTGEQSRKYTRQKLYRAYAVVPLLFYTKVPERRAWCAGGVRELTQLSQESAAGAPPLTKQKITNCLDKTTLLYYLRP